MTSQKMIPDLNDLPRKKDDFLRGDEMIISQSKR